MLTVHKSVLLAHGYFFFLPEKNDTLKNSFMLLGIDSFKNCMHFVLAWESCINENETIHLMEWWVWRVMNFCNFNITSQIYQCRETLLGLSVVSVSMAEKMEPFHWCLSSGHSINLCWTKLENCGFTYWRCDFLIELENQSDIHVLSTKLWLCW